MLGEKIPAAQALEWGLINRVVADDQLAAEGDALLAKLAAGPTRAYAGIKRQLAAWSEAELGRQLELEAEIQRGLGRTSDFGEGVAAFVARRPAEFTGA